MTYLYQAMMSKQKEYEKRGVSAGKSEVHAAVKGLDKGLYPNAFCKILPYKADEDFVQLIHADTAGTKTSLAYMYWRETGDLDVWRDIAVDALVMNTDDMACVGCLEDILISSTIGRNKHLIPGEVLKAIIEGTSSFLDFLNEHEIAIVSGGGETADVGDIVRTADIGVTAYARMPKEHVIDIDIQTDDVIVGLAGFGSTQYAPAYNSGIGSNGLTLARHSVLDHSYYLKYPEAFSPETEEKYIFCGKSLLTDTMSVDGRAYPIGKMLLSPTRTFLPVLKSILDDVDRSQIHGIIHNTGGALTKAMKFSSKHHLIKDRVFPTPPIFKLIQKSAQVGWQEMYEVFNMGQRMEIYCDAHTASVILEHARSFELEARIIGRVEPADHTRLTVISEHGKFEYYAES